jgi:transposase
MKKIVIGIDASKEKLDLCLRSGEEILKEVIVVNTTREIKVAFRHLFHEFKIEKTNVLVCAEHTGRYTYPLSHACHEAGITLWLENPAEIKYGSGVHRGKNDKVDARKIAMYAIRFQDKVRPYSLPDKHIAVLKDLVSERDMHVAAKAMYRGQLTDLKRFTSKECYAAKCKRFKVLIKDLEVLVDGIEREIQALVEGDETMSRQRALLLSIDGVGEQTAIKMIVETNAFRDFANARKFCCHAGVAPFSYSSGSSLRSRAHVSHKADKSIKTLLHMAALAVATRKKSGELHEYYTRKVEEGKSKMSVLNAVRAKLVLRMFAVIRNNNFYEKDYRCALA